MPDVKEQINEVGLELTARGIEYEYIDAFDRPAIGMAFGGGDYKFNNIAITVAFDDDGESGEGEKFEKYTSSEEKGYKRVEDYEIIEKVLEKLL